MTTDDVRAEIARARPFIDANFNGEGWKPSELLSIMLGVLASGPRPSLAADAVREMLAEARNRYAAGFYADPFCEPVQVRPSV